jgi:hypothetical protein
MVRGSNKCRVFMFLLPHVHDVYLKIVLGKPIYIKQLPESEKLSLMEERSKTCLTLPDALAHRGRSISSSTRTSGSSVKGLKSIFDSECNVLLCHWVLAVSIYSSQSRQAHDFSPLWYCAAVV